MVGVRGSDEHKAKLAERNKMPGNLDTMQEKRLPASSSSVGKMSTLDYLRTKVRRHVRSTSDSSQHLKLQQQQREQHLLRQQQKQLQRQQSAVYQVSAKPSFDDDAVLKSSDDEEAVCTEDATLPAPHNRPPSFNPEDYAIALAKFSRTQATYVQEPVRDKKGRLVPSGRDTKAVICRDTAVPEMSNRQFSSLPELLKNLKDDLSVAYISFVKEVVREPHDGAWLLLDLLRSVQHAQTALHAMSSSREQQSGLRRALLDEHSCLCCLRYCLRCADSAAKLADYQHGLYALAVATMSNLARSRTIALQLLTRVTESSTQGHRQVLDALASLRLRFAESVRCKFLVSMLQSHPTPSFAVWSLRLLNAVVTSAETLRQRIHLQEELIEAGFDPAIVKKTIERNGVEGASFSAIQAELERWSVSYVDVSELGHQLGSLQTVNITLTHELAGLRDANMKLLEENVLLKAVGGEVQEHYIALQRRLETNGLPSAPSPIPSVTDSDISSIGPVRRGTILRRPSRSSSGRSFNTIDDNITATTTLERIGNKDRRSNTPDVLPRRSVMAHVNSDTFTYASGHCLMKEVVPEPLPRSTSLGQSPDVFDNNQNNRVDSTTVIAPCYVNPMDLRADDINLDDTFNRYTPPLLLQRQNQENLPAVHKKNCASESKFVHGQRPNSRRSKSPRIKEASPNSRKRRAPNVPPNPPSTNKNSNSPLSSSTSSLSSASSGSSSNGGPQRDHENQNGKLVNNNNMPPNRSDPEYQNVPRRSFDRLDSQGGSDDGDYERDMVVYEAITIGNEMIELVSGGSSSGSSSQASSTNRQSRSSSKHNTNKFDSPNSNVKLDNYIHLKSNLNIEPLSQINETSKVRKSVKHYENMVTAESDRITAEIEKQNKKNKLYANSKDLNDYDEDSHMKSAESSLSLDSQDTVKENNTLNLSCADRASPDGRNSDELEIVPSRQPQMMSKVHRTKTDSSYDPIMLFEFDSPTETSDTETLNQTDRCPPSPRTIETESTRSFGFIQPDKNLRRRDTLIEHTISNGDQTDGQRKGLRRSESFQAGDGSEVNFPKNYNAHRRGSTDLLIDSSNEDQLPHHELYINGRTFTKYAPQDVIINNEVNELLTAALNRRQCRSVEDRLDQWLEEDLRRHNPEILQQSRNRNRNKKRESGRSSSSYDDNRILGKLDKNNNKNKNYVQQKQSKNKPHQKRFSSSDLIAFNGFMNPSPGFIESDYGSNFMMNKPTSKRKTEFLGDKAEFGVHDFPAHEINTWATEVGRWPETDPAIPTPDYGVTPSGTLTTPSAHHILDMPSGLY